MLSALKRPVSTLSFFALTVEGNTFSSLFFQLSSASFSDIEAPASVKVPSAVTVPTSLEPATLRASARLSAGTSAMMSAISFLKNSSALRLSLNATPRPLPNAILLAAAASPYASSAYADTILPFLMSSVIWL